MGEFMLIVIIINFIIHKNTVHVSRQQKSNYGSFIRKIVTSRLVIVSHYFSQKVTNN